MCCDWEKQINSDISWKIGIQSVIKVFTTTDTNKSPSFLTVKKSGTKLKQVTSIFVMEHSGWTTARTEETIAKIHNAVLSDWQLKVHMLANIVKISVDCPHLTWTFGYEKAVGTMDAMLVNG